MIKRSDFWLVLVFALLNVHCIFGQETDWRSEILEYAKSMGEEPLKASPEAETLKEHNIRINKWFIEKLLPKQTAKLNEAEQARIRDYVSKYGEETMPYYRIISKDRSHYVQAVEEGKALEQSNLGLPIIIYIMANCVDYKLTKDYTGDTLFRKALANEQNHPTDPLLTYLASWRLANVLETVNKGSEAKKIEASLVQLASDCVKDESVFSQEDGEIAAEYFQNIFESVDDQKVDLVENELRDFLKKPGLPEWARLYFTGILEINVAWFHRGSGWANNVTEDGWKQFSKHIQEASDHLSKAWEINQKLWGPATYMVAVANVGDGKGVSPREWLNRDFNVRSDLLLSFSKHTYFMLPKWGGTIKKQLAFACVCAAYEGKDGTTTAVSSYFESILKSIISDTGKWRELLRGTTIGKTLCDLNRSHLSDPKYGRYYHIQQLVYCWVAGRLDEASEIVKDFDDNEAPKNYFFNITKCSWQEMIGDIKARKMGKSQEWENLKTFYQEKKLTEALELSASLKTHWQKDKKRVPAHLLSIELSAKLEQQLEKGETVTLECGKNLLGWHRRLGNWSEKDQTLVLKGDDNFALILHELRVGKNFEMSCDVKINSKDNNRRSMCIALGQGYGPFRDYLRAIEGFQEDFISVGFEERENKRIAVILNEFWDSDIEPVPLMGEAEAVYEQKMSCLCMDGVITLSLNGKEYFQAVKPRVAPQAKDPVVVHADGRIGFALRNASKKNTVTISNIKVRRILDEKKAEN